MRHEWRSATAWTFQLVFLTLAVAETARKFNVDNRVAQLSSAMRTLRGVHATGALQLEHIAGSDWDLSRTSWRADPPQFWPTRPPISKQVGDHNEDNSKKVMEKHVQYLFPWFRVPTTPQQFLRLKLGFAILLWGLVLWCCCLPWKVHRNRERFHEEHLEGRAWSQYAKYSFGGWMSESGFQANLIILGYACLAMLVFGGLLYSMLTFRSPVEGMWLVFIWASAAAVDPWASTATCAMALLATIGGLVLVAVFLSILDSWFRQRVAICKDGQAPVIEVQHLIVVGYSSNTKLLLEELGIAEEKQTKVVLLAEPSKAQTEDAVKSDNVNLHGLKLVVCSGRSGNHHDLRQAAAESARTIIIAEDTALSREESDAQTFEALLTLRGQCWPTNEESYVVVQCALARNAPIMMSLYPNRTLVVNGETLGRLMVQSSCDPGLSHIFSQIIGFEGDEFYSFSAEHLGVAGRRFRDIAFYFPTAVPLGIMHRDGSLEINPAKDHKVSADDAIIVLTEDASSCTTCNEAFFDYAAWARGRRNARFTAEVEFLRTKSLICNYNDRGVGPSILSALDEMMGPGSTVDIYTGMAKDSCDRSLEVAQRRQGRKFQNVKFKIRHEVRSKLAAAENLENLPLESYDHIFLVRDEEEKPDKKIVAEVIQMQAILAQRQKEFRSDPVVEIGEKTTADELFQRGITNYVNTKLILARALALCAMNKVSHGVLTDLLSADGSNFDIQDLRKYLADDEKLPMELSFAEATAYVSRASQQVLVGWSQGIGLDRAWVMNPKDKIAIRAWCSEDKLVVIKDV